MQNQKTKKIQRLRSVALDENEAPKERIIAAAKLLTDFGPSGSPCSGATFRNPIDRTIRCRGVAKLGSTF
jgi:hypothetical protein